MRFILLIILMLPAMVGASEQVKDRIYDTKMRHYAKYRKCIKFTAKTFNLPEMLILAVLHHESGTTGKCNTIKSEKNKVMHNTTDCGPMQINNVRAAELKTIGLKYTDVKDSGCKNIVAGGYLLAQEIRKSGDFWSGVGNYHYHKSGDKPYHHYKYIKLIHKSWKTLLTVKENV